MKNINILKFFLYFLFSLTVVGFFVLVIYFTGVYNERRKHIPRVEILRDYNNTDISEKKANIVDISI